LSIEELGFFIIHCGVTGSVVAEKRELRRIVRERMDGLSIEAQSEKSKLVCDLFLRQEVFERSESILLYMPLAREVDVQLIFQRSLAEKKRVALPRFSPETGSYGAFFVGDKPLVVGAFGILEPAQDNPVPLNRLDLVVVPGVGFDSRGRRLGRGKGFYDRLLSEATGVKCGVCFDEQLLETIPVEPHDVGVDFLATPSRWLDCRGSSPEMQ
jgi:5-formyltetrahydrofolate cyclo-ligase